MLPEKPLHTFYKYSSLMDDLIQTASEGFLNTENVKGLMMALNYSSWDECRIESHRTKSHRQKVTDEKSQDKKSQFKFCILTKHIGQKVTA